jgi:LemA protein
MTGAAAIVLAAIIAIVALWAVWAFNRLIRYRNSTRSGWSDIDVQLQRRHDLIPQLVDAVAGYARFEQATLSAVTELRNLSDHAAHLADKAAVEEQVADFARQLIAVAEAYPDLKANRNFLALQQELTRTEDTLQYARRFYTLQVTIALPHARVRALQLRLQLLLRGALGRLVESRVYTQPRAVQLLDAHRILLRQAAGVQLPPHETVRGGIDVRRECGHGLVGDLPDGVDVELLEFVISRASR